METFAVDKTFYDIGTGDCDLWDLDPEVLKSQTDLVEWSFLEKEPTLPGVVLHDRLMTDAALGTGRPIKTEHSYSLTSDGDSLPDSPISSNKMDDMEDECFPAISMNTACGRVSPTESISIKDEPMSDPESPHSSCPTSPMPHFGHCDQQDLSVDADMIVGGTQQQSILKQSNVVFTTRNGIFTPTHSSSSAKAAQQSSAHHSHHHSSNVPKISIKLEPGTSGFNLPPTPPSCSSDDSEDNAPPPSPGRPRANARMLLSSSHTTTRQPIHTPLISSQPKGSTGTLMLTEEEKRTLLAEGYPVPTRLPLTKAEEKSLKKIRRKIKNKISAQESRRKKKEYMDQLERKVEVLVTENNDFRKKVENLEDSNKRLLNELAKLQAVVARSHSLTNNRHK